MLRIGSLFSGAGGLDMAVEQVFGGHTVWHCELDSAASKVLAHRWPGVPNHHDITAVDWSQVEPVEVLCGGWPCQPFSLAGKRKGADDERALWPYVARAVCMVRPRIVLLENVSAVLGPEFQRVANDLAALGYDIAWTCLRASDVGAPHRRERVFIVATDTEHTALCGRHTRSVSQDSDWQAGRTVRRGADVADTSRDGRHEGRSKPARLIGGSNAAVSGDGPLLPTPAVNDIGEGKTVEWWDEWTAKSKAKHGNGNGHGNSLAIEALRMGSDGPVELLPTPRATRGGSNTETVELLPTPTAQSAKHDADDRGPGTLDDFNLWSVAARIGRGELLPTPQARDWKGGQSNQFDINDAVSLLPTPRSSDCFGAGRHGDGGMDLRTTVIEDATQWGKYEPAIRRWESVTRPAPAPTEPNKNGNPRLSAAFSEWLMGWPAGWVTQIPSISRNDQLRIIGNGCVPQQVIAALNWLLQVQEAA